MTAMEFCNWCHQPIEGEVPITMGASSYGVFGLAVKPTYHFHKACWPQLERILDPDVATMPARRPPRRPPKSIHEALVRARAWAREWVW